MGAPKLGIIGGTGLYKMEGLEVHDSKSVNTPFGEPSAPIVLGSIEGENVAFLPRHGLHHQFLPSEINYRANIWALKSLGVRQVVGVSATGSLSKDVAPGDLAIPSQYLDFTKGRRDHTFFGRGVSAHISTAEPSCRRLSRAVIEKAYALDTKIHPDQTYACVEGPRLGTRAESVFLKQAGCHLVGMTNVPEAFLAREAQLCYCTIAIATDYDCWLEDPSQHASVDQVMSLYRANLGRIQKLLRAVLNGDLSEEGCSCRRSLEFAVMTPESELSSEQKAYLAFLKE